MMDAYIEIDSLRSLIKQNNDERYDECKRMMKRNLNLHFLFSEDEAFSDPLIQNWVKRDMMSGVKADLSKPNMLSKVPVWNCPFPNAEYELPLSEMSIDKLCSIYLLDDDEPQSISKAMLVSYLNHEIDTMSHLFVDSNFDFIHHISISKMRSWGELEPFMAPCTDVIIADRYVLSDSRRINNNLYRIIKAVVSKTRDCSINIVIVVEFGSIDNVDLEDIYNKIKDFVFDIVGAEPHVTFVLCKKNSTSEPLFHDRLILTNYRYVTSGDSFKYFDNNGQLKTGGRSLTIQSLAENCDFVKRIIIDEIVSQIQKELKTAVRIIGDKRSRFLSF